MKVLMTMAGLLLIAHVMYGQAERKTGPIIEKFGAVFPVDRPDYKVDTDRSYKVVFDIASSSENRSALNSTINTVARFLNMHAQAGIPPDQLSVAAVFHNKAIRDVLNNAAYRERYGVDNPNSELLAALTEAGVDLYMCGQSIQARGIEREELAEPIQLALSAMTILIDYQAKGYQLVTFNY